MANLKEVVTNGFEGEVLKAERPVLVDFYADWCGPCRAMAPTVEALAGKADGRYQVVKVNVDESPELAVRYEIRGIPTLLLFKDGEVVFRHTGLASRAMLDSALEKVITLAA
jgi:thioredoxin 1